MPSECDTTITAYIEVLREACKWRLLSCSDDQCPRSLDRVHMLTQDGVALRKFNIDIVMYQK